MPAFHVFGQFGIALLDANTMSPLTAAICLGVFAAVFLLVGIALSISGIRQVKLAQSSSKWPATDGKIVSAIVTREESTDTDSSGGKTRIRTDTTFRPRLQFAYEVAGVSYTADQRVIGGTEGYSSQAQADSVIEKYPTGRSVKVYYDPSDPQDGVLEPGISGTPFIWLVAGVVFAIVGVGIFFLMVQMVRMS